MTTPWIIARIAEYRQLSRERGRSRPASGTSSSCSERLPNGAKRLLRLGASDESPVIWGGSATAEEVARETLDFSNALL
jgi:hypothetical protein